MEPMREAAASGERETRETVGGGEPARRTEEKEGREMAGGGEEREGRRWGWARLGADAGDGGIGGEIDERVGGWRRSHVADGRERAEGDGERRGRDREEGHSGRRLLLENSDAG